MNELSDILGLMPDAVANPTSITSIEGDGPVTASRIVRFKKDNFGADMSWNLPTEERFVIERLWRLVRLLKAKVPPTVRRCGKLIDARLATPAMLNPSDTESKVELFKDTKEAQFLLQGSLERLPWMTWMPSRLILSGIVEAKIKSPVTVGQAPASASASDWVEIVVVPQ